MSRARMHVLYARKLSENQLQTRPIIYTVSDDYPAGAMDDITPEAACDAIPAANRVGQQIGSYFIMFIRRLVKAWGDDFEL